MKYSKLINLKNSGSLIINKESEFSTARTGQATFIQQVSVYGLLSGGQSWAASAPFSGCYFEVGKLHGQIYAAHISCEGPGDPNVEEWESKPGKQVLFSSKISMALDLPVGATNVGAVVFASIEGETVEVTRVDVQTRSFGGMSGPIFNVSELKSDL